MKSTNLQGKFNKAKRKQAEVFGAIDTTMAVLDQLPMFTDSVFDLIDSESYDISLNSPFYYLLKLLEALGTPGEKIKAFILDMITGILPTIELGVKATLLARMKETISCQSNPLIPSYLRKKGADRLFDSWDDFIHDDKVRGIQINATAIDPDGMLNISPFSEEGKSYYFSKKDGQTASNAAVLARSEDFNEFLWYTIHKGNRQNPIAIEIADDGTFEYGEVDGTKIKYKIESLKDKNNTKADILGPIRITLLTTEVGDTKISFGFALGATICDKKSQRVVSTFITREYDSNGQAKEEGGIFVPISSDWFSCNWYTNKSFDSLAKNTTEVYSNKTYNEGTAYEKSAYVRDYTKDHAICNLSFAKATDFVGREIPNGPHQLLFSILPRPYVLQPSLQIGKVTKKDENGDEYLETSPSLRWRPIPLLFDENGKSTVSGHYSLINAEGTLRNRREVDGKVLYDVYGYNGQKCANLAVENSSGKYGLTNVTSLADVLTECYAGLTIYEFNYDYIMGLRLFDSRVVAARLFALSMNQKNNLNLSIKKTRDTNTYSRLLQIIRDIVDTDGDEEINDCFYHFSNERYDSMMEESEKLRKNRVPFNDGYSKTDSVDLSVINDILNEYPVNGTLEEQKTILSNAIDAASKELEDEEDDEEEEKTVTIHVNPTASSNKVTLNLKGYFTSKDFLYTLLENLTVVIVEALLSPKVLMLIMVNHELISDGDGEPLTIENILSMLPSMVVPLIKEVRDIILHKMLDLVIEELTPILFRIQTRIAEEQFQVYIDIIKWLLANFNKGVMVVTKLSSILEALLRKFRHRSKNGNTEDVDLPSILDDITYADIYPTDEKDEAPIINDC